MHDFIQLQHLIDQLPVGLLAYLVRVLLQYRRGEDLNRCKPEFFSGFLFTLHYCDDLLYIYWVNSLALWVPWLSDVQHHLTFTYTLNNCFSRKTFCYIRSCLILIIVPYLPSRISQLYRLKACSQLGKIGGSGIHQEQNQLKIEPNYKKTVHVKRYSSWTTFKSNLHICLSLFQKCFHKPWKLSSDGPSQIMNK